MNTQFLVGDQHVDARVVQNVTDLGRLEEIVDGHDDGAGVQNAEKAGMNSGRFLSHRPTRSPGWTPNFGEVPRHGQGLRQHRGIG